MEDKNGYGFEGYRLWEQGGVMRASTSLQVGG